MAGAPSVDLPTASPQAAAAGYAPSRSCVPSLPTPAAQGTAAVLSAAGRRMVRRVAAGPSAAAPHPPQLCRLGQASWLQLPREQRALGHPLQNHHQLCQLHQHRQAAAGESTRCPLARPQNRSPTPRPPRCPQPHERWRPGRWPTPPLRPCGTRCRLPGRGAAAGPAAARAAAARPAHHQAASPARQSSHLLQALTPQTATMAKQARQTRQRPQTKLRIRTQRASPCRCAGRPQPHQAPAAQRWLRRSARTWPRLRRRRAGSAAPA